jgi:hypothetical protein
MEMSVPAMTPSKPPETTIEHWLCLSTRGYYVAALIGLLAVLGFFREQLFTTTNEFISFYAGARFAGTPYLYDKARVYQEQIRAVGGYGDPFLFGRLPFYAALLSPLSRLPYPVAYQVWQAVMFGALLGFIWAFPVVNRRMTLLACCWSLPLLIVFTFAQDVTLMLLIVALALRYREKSPILTGLVMSLFAIKVHLFLLLPLLFLGQRLWKMAAGFSLGAVALTGLSFATAGVHWPTQMASVIFLPTTLPKQYLMPNFRGLLQPFTDQFLPELCLDLIVAALVWLVVRRAGFEFGMAAVISGSLLVSHHAGPQDCAMLIPVSLIVATRATSTGMNSLCLLLLTPVPYAFLTFGGIPGSIAKGLFAAILCATVAQAIWQPTQRAVARPHRSKEDDVHGGW